MLRIILHWTGGSNYPNSTDLEHYHFVIDKDGMDREGKYKPEDNLNCYDGKYAQHTGGGNTGSIGVAVCGMADFDGNIASTKYPLTAIQMENMFALTAKLCHKYNIKITPDTVLTHYEFGRAYPKTSSRGKIDLTYLPPFPSVKRDEIGNFIRNKVKWYYDKEYGRKII